MIKGFEHVGTTHLCNVCSCDFTDAEGGLQGYFGMLPVAFCPTCYSSMVDMVQQDFDEEVEFEPSSNLKKKFKTNTSKKNAHV